MNTELTVRDGDAYTLVQAAIEKGMDPAQMKELFGLVSLWKREKAAEEFAEALTGFQGECPVITKEREVKKDSRTIYTFASYDDVYRVAAPLLRKYKIVPTFTSEQIEGGIKMTCRIRVGIHCEETTVSVPIPGTSSMTNAVQVVGQALTYVKRYALCAALNIVVTDEDQDAVNCFVCVSAEELQQIESLLAEKRVDTEKFLAWVRERAPGVKGLRDIPQKEFNVVIDTLRRRKA